MSLTCGYAWPAESQNPTKVLTAPNLEIRFPVSVPGFPNCKGMESTGNSVLVRPRDSMARSRVPGSGPAATNTLGSWSKYPLPVRKKQLLFSHSALQRLLETTLSMYYRFCTWKEHAPLYSVADRRKLGILCL